MLKHAVIPFLLGAGLLSGAPSAVAASNLVFCSEGSQPASIRGSTPPGPTSTPRQRPCSTA